MKDELKKKDEQKLADMQEEIKRAVGKEEAEEAEAPPAEGEAGAEAPEEPKEEVTLAKEELEKLQAAVQEKEERALRLQADFENFRRRTAKEKEELSAVVTQGILKDMLPLLDNFERAMAAEAKDIDSFKRILIESGRSSWMYLQNVYANPANQSLSVALSMAEHMLQGSGAWRVHGGGFAGTTLNLVPQDTEERFLRHMGDVFGDNACHVLSVRREGAVIVF